jgi:hypothetical protein
MPTTFHHTGLSPLCQFSASFNDATQGIFASWCIYIRFKYPKQHPLRYKLRVCCPVVFQYFMNKDALLATVIDSLTRHYALVFWGRRYLNMPQIHAESVSYGTNLPRKKNAQTDTHAETE